MTVNKVLNLFLMCSFLQAGSSCSMVCMVPKGCKTEMKQGMQHVLVNHTVWHTFEIIVFPTMAKKGIGGIYLWKTSKLLITN